MAVKFRIQKKFLFDCVIAFLAGALLTLAFAPFEFPICAIISIAILFYQWIKSDPVKAFITGYCYGFGMFGTGVNWLHISINLFGGVNLFGAYLITYSLVAFLALYPALVGFLARKYFRKNDVRSLLLVFPALWVLLEWCRSWIFTGFPWLNLGYSAMDTWIAGFAPVIGVYGLTWIMVFCTAIIASSFILKQKCRYCPFIILLVIFATAYSIKGIDWTTPDQETRSVALVQANISQELKWSPEIRKQTIDQYISMTRPHWNSDLIIWPETAIPMFYQQAEPLINALQEQSVASNTDMIIGIPYKDTDNSRYYNSMITLGKEPGIYHKRHLVPFGEYLPLNNLLRPLLDFIKIPMSNFSSGSGRPILTAAGIPIGVTICYEDVFGEEVIDAMPDAKLLVNISNDAWFGDSLAPHQHMEMARMRALETGRFLLRSTNTGISAIIDEKGNIVSESPQFKPDTLTAVIKIFSGSTPYSIYGNYPIVVLAILILLACFYLERKPLKPG